MKGCVVCFGDEILSGAIINTNAQFISKTMHEMGIAIVQHIAVSDFDQNIEKMINAFSLDYDLIICSGGLGPTVDDKTRDLCARLSHSEMCFNDSVYRELVDTFGPDPYHKIQATLPKGATLLVNKTGTAKGLYIKLNKAHLFALPGVPHEMHTMLIQQVVPLLKKQLKSQAKCYEKTISFFDLIETQLDPYLKQWQQRYPDVKFGIYPHYGIVKVTFQGMHFNEIDSIETAFKTQFSDAIFTYSGEKLEKVLYECLKNQNLKLAVSESITGGEISRKLVAIPGVSSQFLGSFVTYSNELKKSILGVCEKTLSSFGAVSEQTAYEMLQGTFRQTTADVAIAVTGIAGPTSENSSKPIGLVYIAVGDKQGRYKVHTCHFKGDRDIIIEKTAIYALGYLLQFIKINN